LSVVATGKHTEIVLTRGVGLHTILGFTVDLAVGNVLDRAGKEVADYCRHKFGLAFDGAPTDSSKRKLVTEFVQLYNKQNPTARISESFFAEIE
jgi:tRNA A37 threonylcarbamoyltransferase TsaD